MMRGIYKHATKAKGKAGSVEECCRRMLYKVIIKA
jgi:hypothetical protein